MAVAAFVFLCLFAAGVPPAFAQGTSPPPVAHDQIVSANPFGLLAGWFNAEYERKLTPTTTWGLSGSMWDFFDEFEYRSGTALLRYYPQRRALDRFFLGVRLGVHHVHNESVGTSADRGATYGGVGFDLGYTWLLGPTERVGVSIGAGATRLFGGDLDGANVTLPSIRLVNVGVAF
jgi:hypothetical protein